MSVFDGPAYPSSSSPSLSPLPLLPPPQKSHRSPGAGAQRPIEKDASEEGPEEALGHGIAEALGSELFGDRGFGASEQVVERAQRALDPGGRKRE
jgi:hypothetical protein